MRPRWQVISALGVFEILAWGSSVYLPAVLALPISKETGWPLPWVAGGVSVGLLVSAAASPRVGSTIATTGGRTVLAFGAILLALGLAILGLSPNLPTFLAGWVVIGFGNGHGPLRSGLRDPRPPLRVRREVGHHDAHPLGRIRQHGLLAPLGPHGRAHLGWRGACLAYAAPHVCVTLPLALVFVPRTTVVPKVTARREERLPPSTEVRRAFLSLVGLFALCSTIFGLLSVHLLTLLQARGETLAAAVAFGAMVGPSQVGARVLEMAGRERHHPLWTLRAAVVLTAVGVCSLAFDLLPIAAAMVFYGAGNGILSIARGTVPLALFGPETYAAVMGRLARPTQIAQALAPTFGAAILASAGAHATLVALSVLSVAALGIGLLLHKPRPEPVA